jgi:hypothetical protein
MEEENDALKDKSSKWELIILIILIIILIPLAINLLMHHESLHVIELIAIIADIVILSILVGLLFKKPNKRNDQLSS